MRSWSLAANAALAGLLAGTPATCACGPTASRGDTDADVPTTEDGESGADHLVDVGFDRTWEAYDPPDVPDICDPFTSAGCDPGYRCYLGTPSSCLPVVDGGDRPPGETCGAGCAVGAGCYGFEGLPNYCVKYCRLDGAPPDCSDLPGTSCKPTGHPFIGICYPPVVGL
jgi:hypothetical protein